MGRINTLLHCQYKIEFGNTANISLSQHTLSQGPRALMLLCGRTLKLRKKKKERKRLQATAMENKHFKASCYKNEGQRFTEVVLKLLVLAKEEA